LQRVPNVAISEVTGYAHYVLPMNVTMAPFDNVHVRLAIKHGIDRQEVVDKIFLGHATPGNDNPIAPSIKYSIDPEPKHSYDPDKAKFHLKEAGLSSLQVDLSAADAAFGGAVDTAVLFKEHASKGGIDINVVREPADGYWDNVWLKKAWCASYWSGRPTIDWMFSTAYKGGAAWNETFWANPRFDELLPIARRTRRRVARCTPRCSSSCTTTAARSCWCSTISSGPTPPSWPTARSRRTGSSTACGSPSVGGSPKTCGAAQDGGGPIGMVPIGPPRSCHRNEAASVRASFG
jgi:hypothetical protein